MRKINYDECLSYVRDTLKLPLFPYQEEMLRALCNGEEFLAARGIGRSYVANCFGRYIA